MITLERSFDYSLIREILTHRHVYPHISDDGSPPVAEYRPSESEAIWYVLVRDDDEILGLWMAYPHNSVCWECHTCLLPNAWGKRAVEAAIRAQEWVWKNTPCRRLIGNVPDYNRLAYRFALRTGMTVYGVNEASFLHQGKLYDQICVGISPQPRRQVPGSIGEGVMVCQGQQR